MNSLQKLRRCGGIGLPNLLDYYKASLLDQPKFWISPSEDRLWVSIEQTLINQQDFMALLAASLLSPTIINKMPHPTIAATVDSWRTLISSQQIKENLPKLDMPIQTYEWLIPGFKV